MKRLEPDEGQLSCPVLRGGNGGNVVSLPDNGDIGRISAIDLEQSTVAVDFDGRMVTYDVSELDEVSLAYAASIHKSQGSEYPAVVIPLALQHYLLLERNLLYTGVTRGKQLVVVIAEPKALKMAVRNRKATQRITRLAERLAVEQLLSGAPLAP
jgi:exodeoxyribonuclease V alpha subunit